MFGRNYIRCRKYRVINSWKNNGYYHFKLRRLLFFKRYEKVPIEDTVFIFGKPLRGDIIQIIDGSGFYNNNLEFWHSERRFYPK
jgi:hypothetical protein